MPCFMLSIQEPCSTLSSPFKNISSPANIPAPKLPNLLSLLLFRACNNLPDSFLTGICQLSKTKIIS